MKNCLSISSMSDSKFLLNVNRFVLKTEKFQHEVQKRSLEQVGQYAYSIYSLEVIPGMPVTVYVSSLQTHGPIVLTRLKLPLQSRQPAFIAIAITMEFTFVQIPQNLAFEFTFLCSCWSIQTELLASYELRSARRYKRH